MVNIVNAERRGGMKKELICAIIKNFGRLLSWDFWYKSITNPDFPTCLFIKMTFISAFGDIFLMITKPGYPPNPD